MNIWLITSGEPLPIDSNSPRLMRTGIFANFLADKEHNVTWWSSTFNHSTKKFRYNTNTKLNIKKNLDLYLLHGKGYKHNISLDRFIDHKQVANNFSILSKSEQKPDIIVASFPTPDLAAAAVKFGKDNNIPVIIDVRDLWPEVFIDVAPIRLKFLAKILVQPLILKNKNIFNNATGIVGLTDAFLDISLKKINRSRSVNDGVFPLAYKKLSIEDNEFKSQLETWQSKSIDTNAFIVCFFGSIGHHSDLQTVIDSAKILDSEKLNVQFVFCGTGDTLNYFKNQSKGLNNVHFPGYIGRPEIISMMKIAKLGIIPYNSTINYMNNITNKAIEYLSEGLPILTGIEGFFGDFIRSNKIGFTYTNGDPMTLVETIKNVYNNDSYLNEPSINAYKLYEQSFTSEKVYEKYMNHLIMVTKNYKN